MNGVVVRWFGLSIIWSVISWSLTKWWSTSHWIGLRKNEDFMKVNQLHHPLIFFIYGLLVQRNSLSNGPLTIDDKEALIDPLYYGNPFVTKRTFQPIMDRGHKTYALTSDSKKSTFIVIAELHCSPLVCKVTQLRIAIVIVLDWQYKVSISLVGGRSRRDQHSMWWLMVLYALIPTDERGVQCRPDVKKKHFRVILYISVLYPCTLGAEHFTIH